jgi:hypothetical protein
MPVTLVAKSNDAATKAQREATAQRVLDYFGARLPRSRMLVFLDDEDPPILRHIHGPANRGMYGAIHDCTPLADWPYDVSEAIYPDDGFSIFRARVVDDLVYLHGTTCLDEVGLTMTLAHELQHSIQHNNARELWAVNSLIPNLSKFVVEKMKLTWADIPTEAEARIVSKMAAEALFDGQRVGRYIDDKIAQHVSDEDVADWHYVRGVSAAGIDLERETKTLFGRLREHRAELETLLAVNRFSPDYADIDLDRYFT